MTDITKENFQQEVLGPKVPVILFFASENSDVEDCKKQQEILQDIEKELNESVKVCVLNVDAQPFLALNYGITAGLTGTNFYNDWYVPSAAELYDIIDKIDIVQKSLTAAGGYDLRKDELESAFWSSNSTGFSPYYAVVVRYTDKLVYHDVKFKNAYYANNVMVLRNF